MANRTIVVPNDYTLTDLEIRVILEASERGKRAEVGADLEFSWQRGHMTKKMLTLRSECGSAHPRPVAARIREMEF
jgi:hypothetical protein